MLFGTPLQRTPQFLAFGQPPTCPSDNTGRYSVSHQHILDSNLITQHSVVAKQHGLPTLLRQLFDNSTDGTIQPLDSTNSSMIEAVIPKASAPWGPLTAGPSVSCINSFVLSDYYLREKTTSSTCAPVSNPPPVHFKVTPLVSFLGNRFFNLCFHQQHYNFVNLKLLRN